MARQAHGAGQVLQSQEPGPPALVRVVAGRALQLLFAIQRQGFWQAARIDDARDLGTTEALVQQAGDRRIVVEIPGETDPESALATLKQTGLLEFVDFSSLSEPD